VSASRDSHTQRQWEGKFFRCSAECWYCRVPLTLAGNDPARATKDHLTPLSRGGSDAISNIVPACIDCNRLKGDMTEEEFRTARRNFRASDSLCSGNTVGDVQNVHNCPMHPGTRLSDSGKCFRCTDYAAAKRPYAPEVPEVSLKREVESVSRLEYETAKKERERVSWSWRHPA
jgi:hypothetical protein